jgi:hypothetical protein
VSPPDRLEPRIKAAAAVTGHSVDPMLSHLSDVIREVVDVEVATNADATAIGVSLSLQADRYLDVRMHNLANAISSSTALARAAELRNPHLMRVERGIGPTGRPARGLAGVFSTVYHLEPRPLDTDLALAAELGIPRSACDDASRLLRDLTGTSSSTLRVIVYTGPASGNMQLDLGALAPSGSALAERAGAAGLSGEDLTMLSVTRELGMAIAWVTLGPDGVFPGLRVEYAQPGLDDALAVVGKYGDITSVQHFLTALESRALGSLVLTLGTTSPLGPVWMSAIA